MKRIVRKATLNKIGRFTKQDIREPCPALGVSSIERAGISIKGRSSCLRISDRTTGEIRKFAFVLLNGASFDDLDDEYDNGKGMQSLTHGQKPEIKE